MAGQKGKSGGTRDGAGRKKTGRTIIISACISPEAKEKLENESKKAHITMSEVIDNLILKS